MEYGLDIERFKKAAGNDTQQEISEKINCSQGNVSKLMTGKQQPTLDVLCRIAEEYHVSLDWLMGAPEKKEITNYADIVLMIAALMEAGVVRLNSPEIIGKDGTRGPIKRVESLFLSDFSVGAVLYELQKIQEAKPRPEIERNWITDVINEYSQIPYEKWNRTKQEFWDSSILDHKDFSADELLEFCNNTKV